MKRENIAISKLLLDAENPRLTTVMGTVLGQAEALERLVVIRPDHLRNLAEDIAERGLHPGIDGSTRRSGDVGF